ncbi:MAG: RNA-guided pseudouridylation complex pseudouridine synthase subunit Cbf5 [Candidatus Njordarchaeales archaeon]
MPRLPKDFPFENDESLIYKTEKIETNPNWGHWPDKRPIEEHIRFGVINLDKPPNLTSHEVSAYIAKLLSLNKVAHGGTLDPGVSGILPIALERATPIARTWLPSDKIYVVAMRLHKQVDEEKVKKVLKEFEGPIYQRPPLRSAVVRRTRIRRIYKIDYLEMLERDVLFIVHCQAGTYMRKLCTDIGDVLGVGAHMIDLRRLKSGPFYEDDTLRTLQDLVDAWTLFKEEGNETALRDVILPAEVGILHLPRIIINDGAVGALTYGAQLYVPGIVAFSSNIKKGDLVAILTVKGELVGLARVILDAEEIKRKEKGQVTDDTRILMPRNLYPPMWKKKV